MSRAFVKEDGEGRWTPPSAPLAYRVVLDHETVHETDDLLEALRWLGARPSSGFELRSREGRLLAHN